MGWGRHVAHVSPVIHRADFAFVEEGSAAAEDEIHRAVDSAAAEALGVDKTTVSAALRGRLKTVKGYVLKRLEKEEDK